ncbi:MAG: hypothetical protein M0017_08525 [Desulfobacteraceae bacterium]|nr:hypothetical protein [Desulfobacteraceae bacterium]
MKGISTFTLLVLLLGSPRFTWAADSDRGQTLFGDPALGGSTWGKSCRTCHENGEGLRKGFSGQERFTIMGLHQKGLPEAIDFCIQVTMRGEGLEPGSRDQADLMAYLRSLDGKASGK